MQDPLQFYHTEKQIYEKELSAVKKKLTTSSSVRLLVFLASSFGIYFFFNQSNIAVLIAIIGVILFLYLLIKHIDLQQRKNLIKALIKINKKEIKILNRDYFDLDDGKEFIDANHAYSFDIDLFGKGSFFQYCNRTVTKEGENKLVYTLLQNDISNIKYKQEAIRELAEMPKWRQHFSAVATLAKVQYSAKLIVDWIHHYKSVLPQFLSIIPVVFSLITLLLITLISFGFINFQFIVVWFFIGLGITGFFIKKINIIYEDAGKAKDTFKQYHVLLDKIETASFSSKYLKEKQDAIRGKSKKASIIFNEFSKTLDALDQRNNLLIAFVANGLLLRDLKISYNIELWIKNYSDQVENWFEVIAYFDAQNSLSNFYFNHPNYVFPKISTNKTIISAKKLGHVLLKETQRIDNDFYIENKQFFIITGANMAGKSTFLRTVSLSIMMANIGLPVCAENFDYSPIKLITSMRTSDSLADDESYFFSELKRLKFIVDAVDSDLTNEKYFIILDEILKGTNSTDKAIGSKKFVKKLVASGSAGIIATHDLSLCEIEKELTQIKNYYFDAEIIDNELHFDYQLKNGVCKNMNASFLLKKMKIV